MRETTSKTAKAPSSRARKSPSDQGAEGKAASRTATRRKHAEDRPDSQRATRGATSRTAVAEPPAKAKAPAKAKTKQTTPAKRQTEARESTATKRARGAEVVTSKAAAPRRGSKQQLSGDGKGRTILCVTRVKAGRAFMEEATRLGCRVLVLTEDAAPKDSFPACVAGIYTVRSMQDWNGIASVVTRLYRETPIDRVVPMLEAQVETAARIRELLGIPGQRVAQARLFRDKLAMRLTALSADIPVPYFAPAMDRERMKAMLESVAPPYMLKLRDGLGSQNVQRIDSRQQLVHAIASKGSRIDDFLAEQYIAGDVYHVDSVVESGKVTFALASRYGLPLYDVVQGGNFVTSTVARGSQLEKQLLKLNARVIAAFGLARGVTHIEFIRSAETGELYFLEAANRMPSARIPMVVHEASGVCLYHELAKLEAGDSYQAPKARDGHAGFITTVAKRGPVSLDGFKDKEIVWRSRDPYQPGLIVRAEDPKRVEKLLKDYDKRFATF